jgi:hypothetical protein
VTTFYVSVPTTQDDVFEGSESFTLGAAITGGASGSDTAPIKDDGTGKVYDDKGVVDPNGVVDDDRDLKVSSVTVNEASPFAVFTVTGDAGQLVSLALGDGTATLADYGPALQYFDGSDWVDYTGAVALGDGGTLLVRTPVIDDGVFEGSETFTLTATLAGGASASGTGTLVDDGTGTIFNDDGTPNADAIKDDDRDLDGIDNDIEEQLANLGGGAAGDLNGDGIPDSQQNALATLAWIDRKSFETATSADTVSDTPSNAIITLGVKSGGADADGNYAVDSEYKLVDIEVLSPEDDLIGGGKPAAVGGLSVETPWDPIRFAVLPNEGTELKDLDPSRPGTQILVVIDISRASLDEGYFNAYLKYVTVPEGATDFQADLDGNAITQSDWYDFTRRTDPSTGEYVGDGAVFAVRDGKIVAIELYLTDNAFGDNDAGLNRIFDPGMPVQRAEPAPAPLVVPPQAAELSLPLQEAEYTFDPGSLAREQREPLRFDSALHPLLASAGVAPSYLTESVDGNRFPVTDWMRYFDTYTAQTDWRVAVLPADGDQLAVYRGMADQFVEAEGQGQLVLPWDAFAHSQTDAVVTVEASLANGEALPGWLVFDAKTGTFTYQVPPGWRGELVVRITARDGKGGEASTLFRLNVGERAKASADAGTPGRTGLQEQLREAARQRVAPVADVPPQREVAHAG